MGKVLAEIKVEDTGNLVDVGEVVGAGNVVAGGEVVVTGVVLGMVAVSKRFLTTVILRYCDRAASWAGIQLGLVYLKF